jgi:hypothetical protein
LFVNFFGLVVQATQPQGERAGLSSLALSKERHTALSLSNAQARRVMMEDLPAYVPFVHELASKAPLITERVCLARAWPVSDTEAMRARA